MTHRDDRDKEKEDLPPGGAAMQRRRAFLERAGAPARRGVRRRGSPGGARGGGSSGGRRKSQRRIERPTRRADEGHPGRWKAEEGPPRPEPELPCGPGSRGSRWEGGGSTPVLRPAARSAPSRLHRLAGPAAHAAGSTGRRPQEALGGLEVPTDPGHSRPRARGPSALRARRPGGSWVRGRSRRGRPTAVDGVRPRPSPGG